MVMVVGADTAMEEGDTEEIDGHWDCEPLIVSWGRRGERDAR